MVTWVLRRNSHWILRTQQVIQSFGHWLHFAKEWQTVGHGFNFREMAQVTLGKLECPLIIHVIRASYATNMLIVNRNGNTTVSGNLDVGPAQAQTSAKTHFNDSGNTGFIEMEEQETQVFYTLKLITNMVTCF